MQFNITFKTIFEYVLKKLVLCIQIRFVSTEKTTRIASRASCYDSQCIPHSTVLDIFPRRSFIEPLQVTYCNRSFSDACMHVGSE